MGYLMVGLSLGRKQAEGKWKQIFLLAALWWLSRSQGNVWCIASQTQIIEHTSWFCGDCQVKTWSSFSRSTYGNVHWERLFWLWVLVIHPENFGTLETGLITVSVMCWDINETVKIYLTLKARNIRILYHACSEAQDFCIQLTHHQRPWCAGITSCQVLNVSTFK